MDYDREVHALTAVVTSDREVHALTTASNIQCNCRRTQETGTYRNLQGRLQPRCKNTNSHSYQTAKTTTKRIRSATAAQSNGRATTNRLGPHPRVAAGQARKADQPGSAFDDGKHS